MPLLLAMSGATKTLVVAIVGIVVSGLVGPAATAWATRRANRQQFERDLRARRRNDLRALVDDAAKLLGAGVTNLRIGREAKNEGSPEPNLVKEWAGEVHLLRQRLLLRRPATDPVIIAYATVLNSLESVGTAESAEEYEGMVDSYEQGMNEFLSSARRSLAAPITDRGADDEP